MTLIRFLFQDSTKPSTSTSPLQRNGTKKPSTVLITSWRQRNSSYSSIRRNVQYHDQLKFDGYLARIVPDRKSDGQADAEPVLDKFASLVNQRHMTMGSRRDWQYDQMHEEIDQSAVDETGQYGAAN